MNGITGFAINGVTASDSSGTAVSGVKDVNQDGIDDFLIGANVYVANTIHPQTFTKANTTTSTILDEPKQTLIADGNVNSATEMQAVFLR